VSWKIKDRTDIRYGYLIAKKFIVQDWDGNALWLCKCDCGREKIVLGKNLQNGCTKSCGCLRDELIRKRIGRNNPNYVNGIACGKYTKEILELKEKRRKKDNWICQHCGITQKEQKIIKNLTCIILTEIIQTIF